MMDWEGTVPCQRVSMSEYSPGQISFTRKHVAQGTEVPQTWCERMEGVSG